MATIVHFDISANNPEQLKNFYEQLLGWKIEALPGMDYYFVETTGLEGKKGIGGGISKRSTEKLERDN